MPNATVLPVPVGALAIISCPASISGMAFSLISVISVKPIACVARMISGETFVSSVNCMVVLPFGFIRRLVGVGHADPYSILSCFYYSNIFLSPQAKKASPWEAVTEGD